MCGPIKSAADGQRLNLCDNWDSKLVDQRTFKLDSDLTLRERALRKERGSGSSLHGSGWFESQRLTDTQRVAHQRACPISDAAKPVLHKHCVARSVCSDRANVMVAFIKPPAAFEAMAGLLEHKHQTHSRAACVAAGAWQHQRLHITSTIAEATQARKYSSRCWCTFTPR